MKQIVLNIKDSKYPFFLELLKNFDFIHIQKNKSDSKEEIEANQSEAFKELKQYNKGKLRTTPAKEFLDEL